MCIRSRFVQQHWLLRETLALLHSSREEMMNVKNQLIHFLETWENRRALIQQSCISADAGNYTYAHKTTSCFRKYLLLSALYICYSLYYMCVYVHVFYTCSGWITEHTPTLWGWQSYILSWSEIKIGTHSPSTSVGACRWLWDVGHTVPTVLR